MQLRNKVAVASLAVLPLSAFAQATTAAGAFEDVIDAATTNIGTFGLALVVLAGIGVGFMVAMKYVKKIRGAS